MKSPKVPTSYKSKTDTPFGVFGEVSNSGGLFLFNDEVEGNVEWECSHLLKMK